MTNSLKEEALPTNEATANTYFIRAATAADAEAIEQIEIDAGERFIALEPPYRIVDENSRCCGTFDFDKLQKLIVKQQVWLACCEDEPVGFIICSRWNSTAFIEEIDVLVNHGRRGLATKLIKHACDWARSSGATCMELCTFDAVPWNAPYYEKLGFKILPESEWSEFIQKTRVEEHESGLPLKHRVVMRLDL